MNKPQTFPGYLPAIDRRLEYQAGLLMPAAPPVREVQNTKQVKSQLSPRWLGEDFSHIIVNR
jgi:hypothetical protein